MYISSFLLKVVVYMTSVQNQGGQQIQTMAPMPKAQGYQTIPQPAQQQIMPQPLAAPPLQQNAPMPNYAGVNIQIYNPSVGVPNLNPTGCTPTAQGMPGYAYPPNYYTNQWGQQPVSQNLAQPAQNNGTIPSDNSAKSTETTGISEKADKTVINKETTNEKETTTVKEEAKSDKKTEKRKVVELTDEYIKNLENYLNSQDAEVRMMGAKEVVARLQEDDSRKDDPALNALVNKMLQDPSQQVRFLALAMLDSRTATGDEFTVNVLKNMQNSPAGYGQDAMQAANILLKMSGKTVEKEFEVKDTSKSDKK